MKNQTVLIRHIEDSFGPLWFSTTEAWENLFRTYEGVDKESMRKTIERLWNQGFLERTDTLGADREYRLTEKAGVFRKPPEIPVAQAKPKSSLNGRMLEFKQALERSQAPYADPLQKALDKALLMNWDRSLEYRTYRKFMCVPHRDTSKH
jgi:hypothetical protein